MRDGAQDRLRIDLHVHTAYSYDGFSTPEQLAQTCRRRGITGLAITDHDTIEGALVCRKALPFTVIVGEEVSTQSGHLIGLFLKKTIPPGRSVTETIARIREQGGLVYLPHPFDRVRSSHMSEDELNAVADQVDMVEVFNSRNLFHAANRQALDFANTTHRLHTAGSDAHIATEVGRSYVEMEPFTSTEEFLVNLQGARLLGRRTSLTVRAWIKLRKRLRGIQ
jgi:predicted metal-dependent phosphoesterase TrpH